MTVTLYNTNSPTNAVSKALTAISSAMDIQPFGALDILYPTLITDFNYSFLNCNYCYISEFNRYYFCTVSTDNAGRLILSCEVDVLMTYKEKILNSPCVIMRSESVGKPTLIPDEQLPIIPNQKDITSIIFDSGELTNAGEFSYIITLIGGDK